MSYRKGYKTTGESANVNQERLLNASAVLQDGRAYHWTSKNIGSEAATAEALVEHTIPILREILPDETDRINSISADTCATMELAGSLFEKQLPYTFMVPCDSHGLQLLIKDVLSLPTLKNVLQKANRVVAAFKKSNKMMALLREHQEKELGKRVALASAVDTRWGTQVSTRSNSTIY